MVPEFSFNRIYYKKYGIATLNHKQVMQLDRSLLGN